MSKQLTEKEIEYAREMAYLLGSLLVEAKKLGKERSEVLRDLMVMSGGCNLETQKAMLTLARRAMDAMNY